MAQGIHISDEDAAQLREHVDRHDGMLLFDDFIDAMSLFHDERIEDHILAELDDPATRLIRTLKITLAQGVLFAVILVLTFMTNLAKVCSTLGLAVAAVPWFALALPPIGVAFAKTTERYRRSSRGCSSWRSSASPSRARCRSTST